ERVFTDTTRRIRYFGTKLLNSLHNRTKRWVIHDNLFVRENTPLNSYLVADNERFLRSLNFIQDARILVKAVPGTTDSIDLLVITKDLFSLTGSFSANGFSRIEGTAAERNLGGMGQTIQFSTLFDKNRSPILGYQLLYSKNSIANTFINGTISYTNMNNGTSEGLEDESAFLLRLDRPLVSPYSKMAGGLEVSFNKSQNVYGRPDSLFYNYRYNIYDAWAGYNLSTTRLLSSKNEYRNRQFLAVRYLKHYFTQLPLQVGENYDPIYNNKDALLAELTFFRQEFTKTNYIYGFGTTEDVPYGYNVALTTGWFRQAGLQRPYIGINANRYIYTDKGGFMQYFVRGGTYISKKKWEDASILAGTNLYSRLYIFNNFKLREYLKFSYTRLFNRVTSEPLRINNPLGLQHFSTDSVLGAERLSLYGETYMISDSKLFGFRLSPFAFVNATMITPEKEQLFKSGIYTGLGGGLRVRNENLVFGTIELRVNYFPRTAYGMNSFRIRLTSNIRFRYNSRYVKAPDFIQLNNDEANNVY
ncbi:MAG TPA: hypothetical protein VJ647_03950, partial [Chitinophagaceae bacterium]|nr:hypothetical protein [Chitinophagaceae bacterium]